MRPSRHLALPVRLPWLLALAGVLACGRGPSDHAPEPGGLRVTNPTDPARPAFHDFGRVGYGSSLDHTIVLENTDPCPVKVMSIQGGCSCTAVTRIVCRSLDGSVIEGDPRAANDILTAPPGSSIELDVRVDTTKTDPNRDKLAILRLRSDSEVTPFITFELHVYAERLFTLTPAVLRMGPLAQSHGGSRPVRVLLADRSSPARVLATEVQGEHVHATVDETVVAGDIIWVVNVTAPALSPLGAFRDVIVLHTTGADGTGEGPPLEIEVWGEIVPDVVIEPRQLNFGLLEPGAHGRVQASLRALVPGARVKIEGHELDPALGDHIAVTCEPLAPDATGRCPEWRVVLEADGELPQGRFAARLTLHLDDSQVPEVAVDVLGQVR